ncbi:hypothetical protein KIM372_09590 [Bombiscardovia nodaiensis]|uniref:Uncharacterized protein n=1 Tax=Bombiscardovia nodaiensis TaxID=2932181 RepID=A0ABM8B8A7_9BIFI|nr:hypothetical protein KIM372_09590 [Bombiscardovia nodaiensis]
MSASAMVLLALCAVAYSVYAYRHKSKRQLAGDYSNIDPKALKAWRQLHPGLSFTQALDAYAQERAEHQN